MTTRITRHLIIHGRVQGVFFRESMVQKATSLGVTGWVKNKDDGTVEAVVQGDDDSVNAVIAWAHQGPSAARVDRVEIADGEGKFDTFEKRPSGP